MIRNLPPSFLEKCFPIISNDLWNGDINIWFQYRVVLGAWKLTIFKGSWWLMSLLSFAPPKRINRFILFINNSIRSVKDNIENWEHSRIIDKSSWNRYNIKIRQYICDSSPRDYCMKVLCCIFTKSCVKVFFGENTNM